MEPIDFLYQSEGWNTIFPDQLLQISQAQGHQWAVPVNIHRSNVLWFNKAILNGAGMSAADDFPRFLRAGRGAEGAGHSADGAGRVRAIPHRARLRDGAEGVLGAEGYRGLWTGVTPLTTRASPSR